MLLNVIAVHSPTVSLRYHTIHQNVIVTSCRLPANLVYVLNRIVEIYKLFRNEYVFDVLTTEMAVERSIMFSNKQRKT